MIAALDVAAVPALAERYSSATIAIVIDVLRATTTIVTALENGAARIFPCRDKGEAQALAHRLGRSQTILAGETHSRLIYGFDLDNSPTSFQPEIVAGKTIVMATTNGTKALVEAARGERDVYCAALVNRAAIVRALARRTDERAVIVCSGSEGAICLEDTLCAGAIADGLLTLAPHLVLGDAAQIALTLWRSASDDLAATLRRANHAGALERAGFGADIDICAQLDRSTLVPRYGSDAIVAEVA